MFRSYFISAVRHLLKNRQYAVLNITGLSIGLACFTLIALWVKDELSYDRFHEMADRIYRVGGIFTDESGKFDQAVTCVPLATAMVSDLPEVEDAVRIDMNDAIVRLDNKQFVEGGILGVDPSFFNIFSFKLQGIAYRTTIGWQVFAAAGIATFVITLATVCLQSVQAALANPVASLRNE